ncbi:methyltransferase domain-containing protein [Neoehrlichia mikurensis]|uniref:Class I SAM-dependent methyltransferase n=1 Tax=Neoehrlichia mikurensis TaxID=89586 RepID=A0A9Q9BRN9_9RICK|nr:class I SAM-dependent methyltransferase [Neoehrlichia mikurensis]QXK92019.1 methyltransferase domain-containing protein [Neoehrlichia mikurensis]QXK92477.1 methyltransferase domain-containing protein [Neoehrlichia mikurensis]QXK93712.1 methyltransferase domain-containing protein [Neoehrlichia mikurensis]UTO55315.1 class I SAM-dependent methyltransferase [Neoehrlichia mikurensis]UTO56235.1 class I SAM-dependent methyltransferase [Neoehrlichia mikurensis]
MPIFNRSLVKSYKDRVIENGLYSGVLFDEIVGIIVDRLLFLHLDLECFLLNLGCRNGTLLENLLQKKVISNVNQVLQSDISYGFLSKVKFGYKVVADDEALPFKENTFDVVVSNMSLHNVNHLVNVLRNIRNLLKKKGILIATLFGSKTLFELKMSFIRAEMSRGVAPRILPFIKPEEAILLMQNSGYTDLVVDIDVIKFKYDDIYILLHDLKNMGEGNVLSARDDSKSLTREIIDNTWNLYKEFFSSDGINVSAVFEIIILKGVNQ